MARDVTALTVAQLAADPSLRLRVLVGGRNLDSLVRGIHISDLEHPARYVLPGELLLTNGIWLAHADPREWVQEAGDAGAIAIGFGVTGDYPVVPARVLEACRISHLTLVQVPEDLSFSAIAECVNEHNRSPDASVRLQLTRLRRLLQQLARGEGHRAVLELLRRETQLPVWLIGPGGRSLTDESPPDAVAARAAARAARRGELPCAISSQLSAFGAGADALSTTAVIVGAPLADIDDDARLILEQAAAYIVLEDARQHERESVRSAMAHELVALLWNGELGTRTLAARLEAIGLRPDAPISVVASSNAAADVGYARMGCHAPSVGTTYLGLGLLLVQSEDEAIVNELAELIRSVGADPVLGAGRPSMGTDGLRQAIAEAITAHQLATSRPPRERVVRRLGVGSHRLLLDFIDPHLLQAYREAVVGPLERWDIDHGSHLLGTLAAFLANDGHWRKTAAELHIHHNTLHYRLEKVAALTRRSVDTTDSRVDFALALAIPPVPGHGGGDARRGLERGESTRDSRPTSGSGFRRR
jgi:PucR family transcriptional regulator, purine catabolism regulatory protein